MRLVHRDLKPENILLAGAALLFACAPRPARAPDDFRPRLDAGCSSAQDCDALFAEADRRAAPCVASHGGEACDERLAELHQASVLQSQQREAGAEDERQATVADIKRAEDRVAVERAADAEVKARAGRADALRWQVDASLRREPERETRHPDGTATARSTIADAPLAELREVVAKTRAALEELRGLDAAGADALAPRVEAWGARWDAALASEETCRATPQCQADRLVPRLCEALAHRRGALEGIARERRNPSGYVDKALLHDLGEAAQTDEDTIRELRARYSGLARRAFQETECAKSGNGS